MKVFVFFIALLGSISSGFGQSLYLRTFGDSTKNAIIFLHGGPGYNAASFEATTGQILADQGYYVIVYDRKGEGRSSEVPADFTFEESISDLNFIYDSLNISKASLIGHSFGGVIATKFVLEEQDKVNSLVLISAPLNLQETFKTILHACQVIYSQQKDVQSWAYVNALSQTDSTTIAYSSECFRLAMRNGLYLPKKATGAAKKIIKQFEEEEELYKAASKMEKAGPLGFIRNEKYTTIDLTEDLKTLVTNELKIYAIYGQEDGLYSSDQVEKMANIIGSDNVKYLSRCSHSPFIDQQETFLKQVGLWAQ